MKTNFNDILYALSYGLDCVESELIGVSRHHGKRVAYISTVMGRAMGLDEPALADLSACAILHDCAITEYIQTEVQDNAQDNTQDRGHCAMGERNVQGLPFFSEVRGYILYHHERADGGGPFGKYPHEIPTAARLIHFADRLDAVCNLGSLTEENYRKVKKYLEENRRTVFGEDLVELFYESFPGDSLVGFGGDSLDPQLQEVLVPHELEAGDGSLYALAKLFARIIDYKSGFTSHHSMGFAQKAERMARYYGFDETMQEKLFFAGALHDVGKLIITNDVLEKPGKLDDREYRYIQEHVLYTWEILSQIRGMEDIARWASRHHEKLDGSGYPFGLKAEELSHIDRLMACIDIYQALVEERSYKAGMPHDQAVRMLRNMAARGHLDEGIVEDINAVFGRERKIEILI